MQSRLMKKFRDHKLIKDNYDTNEEYLWYKKQNSRLDIVKFIHRDAYWLTSTPNEVIERKKIIFNDWHALFPHSYPEAIQYDRFWQLLEKEHFELFIPTALGLKRVSSFKNILEQIDHIKIQNKSLIENSLLAKGNDFNGYHIIDHESGIKLVNDFKDFLQRPNANNAGSHPREVCLNNYSLTEARITLLCDLAKQGLIDTWHFETSFGNLTWRQDFTEQQLPIFLKALANEETLTEVIQETIVANQLIAFESRTQYFSKNSFFDMSSFPSLKQLALNIMSIDSIIGMPPSIEELHIDGQGSWGQDCHKRNIFNSNSTVTLPHLKKLTLKHIRLDELDLKNIACERLEELNLESLCAISNDQNKPQILDCSQFKNIKRLNLNLNVEPYVITNLSCCTQLEELTLSGKGLTIDISDMPNLKKLTIDGRINIKGIEKATNLKVIEINRNYITKALNLENNEQLESIEICDTSINNIVWPKNMAQLKRLHYRQDSLADPLPNLNNTPNLQDLKVTCATTGLKGLENCVNLKSLILLWAKGLTHLDISKMPQLSHLEIKACNQLAAINGLDERDYFETFINDSNNSLKTSDEVNERLSQKIKERDWINHTDTHTPTLNSSDLNMIYHVPEVNHDEEKNDLPTSQHTSAKQKKHRQFNTETYRAPTTVRTSMRLFDDETIHPSDYRIEMFNRLVLEEDGTVALKKVNFTKKLVKTSLQNKINGIKSVKGVSQSGLRQHEYMVLPGLSNKDNLIDIAPNDKLDVYFSRATDQYVVKLKENAGPFVPLVHFEIQPKPGYFDSCTDSSLKSSPRFQFSKLPYSLNDRLEKFLNTHEEFTQCETQTETVNQIIKYCRSFKNKKLSSNTINNVDGFMEMIEKKRGACEHRAMACLALCQALDVRCRIIANSRHMFLEIKTHDHGWVAYDVGGTSVVEDVKPNPNFKKQTSLFAEIKKPQVENTITTQPNELTRTEIKIENKVEEVIDTETQQSLQQLPQQTKPLQANWDELFIPKQELMDRCLNENEVMSLLSHNDRATLINLNNNSEAWRFHHIAYNYAKENQLPMLYIDSAKEMFLLFETIKIEHSQENTLIGPLQTLIKQKGMLLVNWNNFNDNERGIFKSIMDNPPSLHGFPLAKDMTVIGLMNRQTETNDIFLTRCDSFTLPKHLNLNSVEHYHQPQWLQKTDIETTDATSTINLYYSAEWEKFLVEDISINKDELEATPGPLVNAMLKGQTIEIVHPPLKNKEFSYFWHLLMTENKVMYNGEYITPKPGFKILFDETTHPLKVTGHVYFEKSLLKNANTIEITQDNYAQLFANHVIDNDGYIWKKSGWLNSEKIPDQFIVREDLSVDQWQHVFDFIKEYCPEKQFHFAVAKNTNGCLSSIKKFEDEIIIEKHTDETLNTLLQRLNKNMSISTNDPEFIVNTIQKKLNVPSKNIFYTSTENIWSQLIESVELIRANGHITAKRSELAFWKKLQAGKTVILSGKLTEEEMRSLKTLMQDPAYLDVNGERVPVTGKLIWVYPDHDKVCKNNTMPQTQYTCLRKDYALKIENEIKHFNPEIWKKVTFVLKALKSMNTFDENYPAHKLMSYEKCKAIYRAIEKQDKYELKSLLGYHYRKNSEHYYFLNVLIKMSTADRKISNDDALIINRKYKAMIDVKNSNDLMRDFWKIANCFDGKALSSLFDEEVTFDKTSNDGVPIPPDSALDNLVCLLGKKLRQIQTKFHTPYLAKQKDKLIHALQSDNHPLIFLMGEAGTGKTYTAKKIAVALNNKHDYKSEIDIIAWLENKSDETKILLLDEANMQEPGKWEFLSGLFLTPPVINYQGKPYPLDTHKVIITGNPVHYAGRHFHPVLWEHGHVIWFNQFEKTFLTSFIEKRLNKLGLKENDIHFANNVLTNVFYYLLDQPLRSTEVTLRDIKNICLRLAMLMEHHPELTTISAYSQVAIWDELNSIFLDDESRQKFKQFLLNSTGSEDMTEVAQPKHLPATQDIIIPKEKYQIWRIMEDALALRDMRIKAGSNNLGKLGLLVEGASGIGKSALALKLLSLNGFSKDHPDSKNRFVQITAGSKDVETILLNAFKKGQVVILDELNLDPDIENLMLQLLTGLDMQSNKAKHPGFMVFTSQNPSQNLGCSSLSRAYLNRLHLCKMDDYSKQELLYIAEKANHPDKERYYQAFHRKKNEYPLMINTRSYFANLYKRPKLFNTIFSSQPLNGNNADSHEDKEMMRPSYKINS